MPLNILQLQAVAVLLYQLLLFFIGEMIAHSFCIKINRHKKTGSILQEPVLQ
jgi:hypothetical protein